MARLLRRRRRRPADEGRGPIPADEAARAGASAPGRVPRHRLDALHQHDPARAGAVVPRRRAPRAPHPRLHPLERGRDGDAGQRPVRRHRRPPLHLRLVGQRSTRSASTTSSAARTTGCPATRCTSRATPRPGIYARAFLEGRLERGPARPLPPGDRRRRPVVVPAPPAHAGLLGVPDRLDGARPDQRHLPGPLQPLPPAPPHRRHVEQPGVVLPRRRRDRRARVARRASRIAGRASSSTT